MKWRAFDPLSFIVGITFVALAGALSLDPIAVTGPALRWSGAGILLLLGTVMLLVSRSRSDDRS